MTTDKQQQFIDDVASGLSNEMATSPGICSGCETCQRNYDCGEHELEAAVIAGRVVDEGNFSWQACDACGSSLGGDRWDAHALDDNNEINHLDICRDCVLYLANGDLPMDD